MVREPKGLHFWETGSAAGVLGLVSFIDPFLGGVGMGWGYEEHWLHLIKASYLLIRPCHISRRHELGLTNAALVSARQGYLISTGEPKRHYISEAVRHVQMRQGTIGIKVDHVHGKLRCLSCEASSWLEFRYIVLYTYIYIYIYIVESCKDIQGE